MDLSLSHEDALFSRLMGHNWLPRYAGSSGTGQEQEEQLRAPGYGSRLFQNNVVMCMQAQAMGRKVVLVTSFVTLFERG